MKDKTINKLKYLGLFFFILTTVVYYLSSGGPTSFNHFDYLAEAFIKGKLYVTLDAPWLEKVPIDPLNFYIPYPPLPAILLLPFKIIPKVLFIQDYLSYLLAAGTVWIMVSISQKIKSDNKLAIWTGLLTGFGTITWYMASVGSSWYLGQICAVFFLTAAIYESLYRKRYYIIGVLIGAAYLSRIETLVTLPFFLYLTFKGNWFRNYIKMAAGIIPFILFNFYYNFARFNVFWDKAYTLIPGVTTESWFDKGLVHLSYIPRHLSIIFSALPSFENKPPFIRPGFGGLAIWFTTPAFLYSLGANIKDRVVQLSWVSILLISLIIFSHGSTGFAQFGYRFAVDFYPFLIFLTIKGIEKTGIKWHHWILLILSIIVNLWGVLWINKFDWI